MSRYDRGPSRLELDQALFDGHPDIVAAAFPPTAPPDQTVTDGDVLKAQVILRALVDAGLKKPFDFNPQEAKYLWAARLKRFTLDELTDAISDWITTPGAEFPSLGDVEQAAQFVIDHAIEEQRQEDATTRGLCPTCSDGYSNIHYVRVQNANGEGHHMAPCPDCPDMEKRRELWDRGHWDPLHIERGGCPHCWAYHPTLAHRAKHLKARAS